MPELTHVALVSNQATPNLTPLLDPAVAPQRVILLVTPHMRQHAEWLSTVLKPRGIRIEQWELRDAYDIEHIQEQVLTLIEREQERAPDAELVLNATGGTKPMSIAAYEVFRAYDLPIFYVHPERDRLIWMHPHKRTPIDLANRLKLGAFLQAHGATVERSCTTPIPPERRDLTAWLVTHARTLSQPLGTLNWLAWRAERSAELKVELRDEQFRNALLADLIDQFAGKGLLHLEDRWLHFRDEDARFYVNGGWLEEHVYSELFALRSDLRSIQDQARSLELHRLDRKGQEVHNEIDVAALAENRLYLIECKTCRWRGEQGQDASNDALYRLDTLVDLLGGLQARAMLISYNAIPDSVQRRANDLRIQTCDGAHLPQLRERLGHWIAPRTTRDSSV